jgi:hypothetical protein
MGSCKDTARTVRELCFNFVLKHAELYKEALS